MKKALGLSVVFILGCATVHTPIDPDVRGCQAYCFPVLTNYLLSLSRSNTITHETDSWHGGVMQWMAGDIVTAAYDQRVCTNWPQNAVTFCWFCSNNLQCVTKQLPSNSYDCDYAATNNCEDCSFSIAYVQAALCGQEQGPRGQFVCERGQLLTIQTRMKQ